jgi:hypothetical protein
VTETLPLPALPPLREEDEWANSATEKAESHHKTITQPGILHKDARRNIVGNTYGLP